MSDLAREQMVQQQVRAWEVLDERVLDTFRKVPREMFVPVEHRYLAFADVDVPLPHGQHMLRPNVAGRLLQALELKADDNALEIGAGSGFLTACLAERCARVTSLELFADLAELARANLAMIGARNAQVLNMDASGLETWLGQQERFDAIAVTASLPVYDDSLQRLLNVGGRLFAVVGTPPIMEALLVRCVARGSWLRESLFETVIDPMINARRAHEFTF